MDCMDIIVYCFGYDWNIICFNSLSPSGRSSQASPAIEELSRRSGYRGRAEADTRYIGLNQVEALNSLIDTVSEGNKKMVSIAHLDQIRGSLLLRLHPPSPLIPSHSQPWVMVAVHIRCPFLGRPVPRSILYGYRF
jgi:hypothetical protein